MADNKKFTGLLGAYLAGRATTEDYIELMQLIKSCNYDDLLRQKIGDALLSANAATSLNADRAGQILSNILSSEQHTVALITAKKATNRLWPWAAAAAALIIFGLFTWVLPVKNTNKEMVALKESKMLQTVPGAKGKKYIHLQDGSTVLLNEGSRLDYPDVFGKSSREVSLIGEGYFDIKHEAGRPFIVHTGKVSTIVLGTAFNIKAYPLQKLITVTVTRGKVKVNDDTKTIGIITPNESISVNTENKSYSQEKVNADDVVEWKQQYLVLDNISMEEAATLIDQKYHVNISFAKEKMKECRISATFLNNENLEQVLTVVTGVVNGAYSVQPNDQVIINGEGCP